MKRSTEGLPLVAALERMTDGQIALHFKHRHPEEVKTWDPTLPVPGREVELASRTSWSYWHSWLHKHGKGSAGGHSHE